MCAQSTTDPQQAAMRGAVREHAAAAALLLTAVLVLFGQLTWRPTDLLVGVQRNGRNDVTSHNLAARDLLGRALTREGAVPTWQPNGLLGGPWLGNPQSAMFYPPHWLFAIFPATSLISWMIVAHHWWAGFGLYFYCRRIGAEWPAATLGGVCFAGAPFLIAQTGEGHSTQVFLIAWAPWALLAYERFRRALPGGAPLTAIALALAFFCGHVQEVYYLVLLLSVFVVCDCITRDRAELDKPFRLLLRWVGVGASTAALVLVELAPNWIYTQFGVRSKGIGSAAAARISAGPESLKQLINPFALGGPDNYTGPGEYFWETLCCFGIAALVLALIGASTARRRPMLTRWVVVAIVSLLFAMGGDTPVFGVCHRFVPGMTLFRAPGRALFFTSLGVAVLAGFGFQSLLHGISGRIRDAALRVRLAAACSAALLIICGAELAYYSNQLCATVPSESLRRQSPITTALLGEPRRGRVLAHQELLTDREALSHGIDKLRRYEPVPLARTMALFEALTTRDPAREITGFAALKLESYRKPLLDMVNVTHVVLPLEEPAKIDGWQLIDHGQVIEELALRGREPRSYPYAIYRNLSPMPRAYIVGETLASPSPSALQLASIDPRQQVLVSHDLLDSGARQTYREAFIVERSRRRLVVHAELDAPGYLVMSEGFYPGWRGDNDTRTVAGNIALWATPLQAGQHRIEFRYTPPGWLIGGVISSAAWLCVVGSLLSSTLRRKRRPRNSSPQSPDASAQPDNPQSANQNESAKPVAQAETT